MSDDEQAADSLLTYRRDAVAAILMNLYVLAGALRGDQKVPVCLLFFFLYSVRLACVGGSDAGQMRITSPYHTTSTPPYAQRAIHLQDTSLTPPALPPQRSSSPQKTPLAHGRTRSPPSQHLHPKLIPRPQPPSQSRHPGTRAQELVTDIQLLIQSEPDGLCTAARTAAEIYEGDCGREGVC